MVLVSKGQRNENLNVVTLLLRLNDMMDHRPDQKIICCLDERSGPGGFLLAPGGPDCKSAGPCHL